MSKSELSPTLLAALHRKLVADMMLMKLQQDMDTGKRVFCASAMLSALEDCDDASGGVWEVLGQALQNRETITAESAVPSTPIEAPIPIRSNTILTAVQQRVRQLLTRQSSDDPPIRPNGVVIYENFSRGKSARADCDA